MREFAGICGGKKLRIRWTRTTLILCRAEGARSGPRFAREAAARARRAARQAREKMAEDLLEARKAHDIPAFEPRQGHLFKWSKSQLLTSLAHSRAESTALAACDAA